jgi:23S rRNA G2069 N7-methylase RlmK/C1962 C5-methylase RlmI
MDLTGKQVGAIALINELKTCRPPTLSESFIETCRISRGLVDSMRAARDWVGRDGAAVVSSSSDPLPKDYT